MRQLRGPDGLRPDQPIGGAGKAHIRQQALQDLDGIGACIDIHIKHGCLHHLGQGTDPRRFEIMIDKDVHRLRPCQTPHVFNANAPITRGINAQAPHRAQCDAIFGRPARIVGVVHKPAFTGNDFFGNVPNRTHSQPLCKTNGHKAEARRLT